ncbi:hypothetical protein B0H13DRAFT_1904632 [Mycena leptocephala]|nr:hypothetical protein B0H13DRAFT_1904632 [Mycena leptocephala]
MYQSILQQLRVIDLACGNLNTRHHEASASFGSDAFSPVSIAFPTSTSPTSPRDTTLQSWSSDESETETESDTDGEGDSEARRKGESLPGGFGEEDEDEDDLGCQKE